MHEESSRTKSDTDKIRILHVMSNATRSQIFSDFLDYFDQFHSDRFEFSRLEAVYSTEAAAIRHYHRPHLENSLVRPCVATVHHDLEDLDPSLPLEKTLPRLAEADKVVCLNEGQRRVLLRHGITTGVVIPHGYNTRFIRPAATSRGEGPFTLGIFSRRYGRKVKGEALLIELAKRLDPTRFAFLLIGQDRHLDVPMLSHLGFPVRCHAQLPYRTLCQAYQEIDALMIASRYEGGPASLPEALASGVPVLATRVGMAPDMVREGENGLFLTSDPDVDAAMLEALAADAARRERLRAGARALASQVPTWRDVVRAYEAVYAECAS